MTQHTATIQWRNSSGGMDYDSFPREHHWEFEGGPRVPASAAAGFKGREGCVDPEEALVAATSACHMLTFLAIASKKKLLVLSYSDRAVGHLEKDPRGRLAVTRIRLQPVVEFGAGSALSGDDLQKLHDSAHHNCFIANSITAAVTVVPG